MEGNRADKTSKSDQPGEEEALKTNWNQVVLSFEEMSLKRDLLRGIFGYGYEKPSAIQSKGITPLTLHKDVIGQAQSGSGKTATFVIGMLQNIDTEQLVTQAVVVAPTRELAMQIRDVIKGLGTYLNVRVQLCTGGTSVAEDRRLISEGVNVVVGTPGRIRDLVERNCLQLGSLKMLIVDEADELLSMGFIDQLNEITKAIPPDCQVALFSATMAPAIIKLASGILRDPVTILVRKEDLTLEGIKQYYIACGTEARKFETLNELFGNIDINQCIIYANTKERVASIEAALKAKEFVVSCIHGNLEQEKRNAVMQEFRGGVSRILISTDLLARGIDVHQVGLVINYELPPKKENYIHRIGRSGRYGRRGIAINLITPGEVSYMTEIQSFYETQIQELPTDLSELDQ